MQKLIVKKEVDNKEEFIDKYFHLLNKHILNPKLSPKELNILKHIYSKKDAYLDLAGTSMRKSLNTNLKVSKSNMSTYLKKFKEMNILVPYKEVFKLHPNIIIKNKEIHFTEKLILND